jgi:hypothetical protein
MDKGQTDAINYYLFDGRYRTKPYRAILFEVCETLSEAKENAPDYGDDTVIVEMAEHPNNTVSVIKIIN